MTRIGWSGTTLNEIAGSPVVKKTASGPEVTETFNCDYASAESAITARGYDFGDACPIESGIYSSALLDSITITKVGPRAGLVVYLWKVPDPDDPNPPVGRITLEGDANTIEIPIGQNANASPGTNYDEDKQVGIGDWEGIEAFLSPQPIFRRSEILSSFTWSESNLVKNVGHRMTAGQMNLKGLSGASTDKWLKVQLQIRESGDNIEQTEAWQYADAGWNTDIYAAAVT